MLEEVSAVLQEEINSGILILNCEDINFPNGFNIGMAYSERDVILLGNDAMVTKDWIEKIVDCAYSDKGIALVTPITNQMDSFFQYFNFKNHDSVDDLAILIERFSLKRFPRVPVPLDRYLYIKRQAINEVGLLDSTLRLEYVSFMDFFCRSEQLGFHHVLCDNTFIYNNTESITDMKNQRHLEEEKKILYKRYENQMAHADLANIGQIKKLVFDNLRVYLQLKNNKQNILYLIHADFREDASNNIGGTQFHVMDLALGLRKEYNIYVAARDGAYLRLTGYLEETTVSFKFLLGDKQTYPTPYLKKYADLFNTILNAFEIHIVHIHHTEGLSLDLYMEARALNIPLIATLHDYYSVCPVVKLLNHQNRLCIGNENATVCHKCLNYNFGITDKVDFISKWRVENEKALSLCDRIIVPSECAKGIVSGYFPNLDSKIQVITHGSDSPMISNELDSQAEDVKYASKEIIDEAVRLKNNRINIAFVGGMNIAKGSQLAYQMIKNSSHEINWFVFGGIGDGELLFLKQKNLKKTSWYKRDELPALINQNNIDLICILPIWPETFCYTLSEALLCKVPVIVTDIGAVGERAKDMDCGWVIPSDSTYKDILELIDKIRYNEEEYRLKLLNVKNISLKSVNEMLDDYVELYKEFSHNEIEYHEFDSKALQNAYSLGNQTNHMGNRNSELPDEIIARLTEAENRLKLIESSIGYKALIAFKKLPIPFKSQIKSILFKIYKWTK
jgi:glycosyltransferase involved in cell wall biosynthesis